MRKCDDLKASSAIKPPQDREEGLSHGTNLAHTPPLPPHHRCPHRRRSPRPRQLFSQQADRVAQSRAAAATTPIKTTKLYDNVFLLQGAGGNMALQTGPDGKILIDSSFSTAVPPSLKR